MPKALLLAWSSPASSEEAAAFDDWYQNVHVSQVKAAITSVTSVGRYVFTDPASDNASVLPRYLTIYELDDADVGKASGLLAKGFQHGKIDMSTTLNTTDNPGRLEWYVGLF